MEQIGYFGGYLFDVCMVSRIFAGTNFCKYNLELEKIFANERDAKTRFIHIHMVR